MSRSRRISGRRIAEREDREISAFAFGSVSLNVIFPLAVTGQLVVNLCSPLKWKHAYKV